MRWRSSRCLSLGCSTLGAKQESMVGEEWNDLSRIVLPLLDLTLPLIYRDRSGTWWFGVFSLWSICAGV
jgi:hypothetical protein